MGRDNCDFLRDLRGEIAAGQQRRSSLIRMKIAATIGLFGLSSFKIVNGSESSFFYLAYFLPFVVLVFDLFIAGEDFSVKRGGRFMLLSEHAPDEEKCWEKVVNQNRPPYSKIAHVVASSIFMIVAAVSLWPQSKNNQRFYWSWILLSVISLSLSGVYHMTLKNRLDEIEKYLKDSVDSNPTTSSPTWISKLFLQYIPSKMIRFRRLKRKASQNATLQ